MNPAARSSTDYRSLFPVTRNLTYLNHAAVGPLSIPAAEAMERHVRDQLNYGALNWRQWDAHYAALRASAAKLIGAAPDEIAILKNTSEGISFVAEGLPWVEGDNVVTTALEFPSNWVAWKRLESRGVSLRVAELPTLEAIARQIDWRTRVVAVSSVAFHTGFVSELDQIGALCASRDILFCVDAIQSLGMLPMDVRRSNIDFLSADGHKWLCAPEGAAIFYVAAEKRDVLRVIEHGWMNVRREGRFIDCGLELLPDSRRFEAGALNTTGVCGLRAAIDLLLELGIEEVSTRAVRVAALLADVLEDAGWRVESPRPIRSAIVAATPPDVEKSLLWWHRRLEENGIVTAPRERMIRFSPHFYNDESDVARVAEVLATLH